MATTTQPKWFFAQSSPSISSVSTEQWRTCATSWLAESLVVPRKCRELVAQNNSETMVMPTELSTTNKTPRTNDNVQGNLLHVYKQKIANLPDHLQLIKLCSNVGVSRRPWRTVSISRPSTMRNWTNWEAHVESILYLGTTQHPKQKDGSVGTRRSVPSLEVAFRHRQGRYGIEIMTDSLFGDGTCSWVMIVMEKNKCVTEMTEETQEDHIDHIGDRKGKLVAKARPKQTSIPTTSSPTVTLPYHQREWIDVEPGQCDKSSKCQKR